jgi:hypothetical protein
MKKMSKQDNRGPFSKLEGKVTGKTKKPLVSYVQGTKPNPRTPAKSLTPKAQYKKK